MRVFLLGVAGPLGLHAAEALLRRGDEVVGVDRPRPAGDPALAEARLRRLVTQDRFALVRGDAADRAFLEGLAREHGHGASAVLDLAGRPRGRTPAAAAARLDQQLSLLDFCRGLPGPVHLVQALPRRADAHPRLADAEERLGRAWSRLHGAPCTAFRLAEVYGPWGPPEGRCWRLADALAAGRPAFLPAPGFPLRLLWIEDAVAGLLAALDRPPGGTLPYRRLELAPAEPTDSDRLLGLVAAALGRPGERRDELASAAQAPDPAFDPAGAEDALGWRPATRLEEGVPRFVAWYREHRGLG